MNAILSSRVDRTAARDQLLNRRTAQAAYRSLHHLTSEARAEYALQDAVWRNLPLILLALTVTVFGYFGLFGTSFPWHGWILPREITPLAASLFLSGLVVVPIGMVVTLVRWISGRMHRRPLAQSAMDVLRIWAGAAASALTLTGLLFCLGDWSWYYKIYYRIICYSFAVT